MLSLTFFILSPFKNENIFKYEGVEIVGEEWNFSSLFTSFYFTYICVYIPIPVQSNASCDIFPYKFTCLHTHLPGTATVYICYNVLMCLCVANVNVYMHIAKRADVKPRPMYSVKKAQENGS